MLPDVLAFNILPDSTMNVSLERMQELLLTEVVSPIKFFELCRSYVKKLASEFEGAVALVLVGADSQVILPVMAHSFESQTGLEADEIEHIIQMMTVFASQSYKLGSDDQPSLGPSQNAQTAPSATGTAPSEPAAPWAFDELVHSLRSRGAKSKSAGPFRVKLREQVGQSAGGNILEWKCTIQGLPPKATHAKDCRVLEPNLAGGISEVAGTKFPDEFFVQISRYTPYSRGSEIYFFVIAEAKLDKQNDFSRLAQEATIAGHRMVEELRSQVSSLNPRHISRFFQIEFGKRLMKYVMTRAAAGQHGFYGEFLRSLFDERGHEVAIRRLLRFAKQESLLDRLQPYLPKTAGSRTLQYMDILHNAKGRKSGQAAHATGSRSTVVVAASPRGGVGKSTVSYALARYLADHGEKTCFVELDLASPTVYSLDEGFAEFLQKYNPGEAWTDPITRLIDVWSKVGVSGRNERRKRLERELRSHTYRYGVPNQLQVIGASPRQHRPGDMLALQRAREGDVHFLDDLVSCLRAEQYQWIFIDTASGLRDFSMAALLMGKADLAMIFAHAAKPALLSALVHIAHWYEGVTKPPRRILVLNEVRAIDELLFENLEAVDDFAVHWGDSQNDGLLPIGGGAGLFASDPSLCDGLSKIAWHEPWSRPERDSDWTPKLGEAKHAG
jgi:cellulose biosynthesis protein BcsQ